jgi:hypothetical protein
MTLRATILPLVAALAVGYTANDLVSPQPSESANTDQQLRYLKFIDHDLYYIHKDIGANTKKVEAVRVAVAPLAGSLGNIDRSTKATADAVGPVGGLHGDLADLSRKLGYFAGGDVQASLRNICFNLADPAQRSGCL